MVSCTHVYWLELTIYTPVCWLVLESPHLSYGYLVADGGSFPHIAVLLLVQLRPSFTLPDSQPERNSQTFLVHCSSVARAFLVVGRKEKQRRKGGKELW